MKVAIILAVVGLAALTSAAPAPQVYYTLTQNPGFTYQQPLTLVATAPVRASSPPRVVVKKVIVKAAPEPEPTAYPEYSYSYKVDDGENADHKEHTESRDGNVVTGKYSLVEPDGTLRIVTYTADSVNGFRATVDRQAPKVALIA